MPGFEPRGRPEPLWLRATAWIDRAYRAITVLREELALSRVPPKTWRRIVVERYGGARPEYVDPRAVAAGLYPWERAALTAFFPSPPARILLGGAGGGRELFALAAEGYEVVAFEPVPSLHESLSKEIARRGALALAVAGGYEELVELVALGSGGPQLAPMRAVLARAPYVAAVLGWGSITHIPSPQTRGRLLEAIAALCPAGPVLLSFLEPAPPSSDALGRLGAAARKLLQALPGAQPVTPGDHLGAHGFLHAYSEVEIEELARAAGYRVAHLGREECPHAVLLPSGAVGDASRVRDGARREPTASRLGISFRD